MSKFPEIYGKILNIFKLTLNLQIFKTSNFSKIFQTFFKYFPNNFQTFFKHCANIFQTLFKHFWNIYQNLSNMSQTFFKTMKTSIQIIKSKVFFYQKTISTFQFVLYFQQIRDIIVLPLPSRIIWEKWSSTWSRNKYSIRFRYSRFWKFWLSVNYLIKKLSF